MQRSTNPELPVPSSSQHPDPDNRPGTRRRSCGEQPVEGEETPAIRKRRKTETEDKRLYGNVEIIWPSGEPSCHLSACPVPLVTNSALTINTEASRDLHSQTSTSLHDSSLAISNVAKMHVNSISSLSTPHRSPDQDTKWLEIPIRWISNSYADPTPSSLLSWSTPERHGGIIFFIPIHRHLARNCTRSLSNPCMKPRFNTTLVKGVRADLSLL